MARVWIFSGSVVGIRLELVPRSVRRVARSEYLLREPCIVDEYKL